MTITCPDGADCACCACASTVEIRTPVAARRTTPDSKCRRGTWRANDNMTLSPAMMTSIIFSGVFPPTKGTPVQAILPDRDGFALSYGDSCDEFPPRWQTATLLERATTRSFRIARTIFRPTHVADAAISRPPAPVRVAADLGTVALCG